MKHSGEICRILQYWRCFRIFKVFPFCLKSRNSYTKYNFLLASIWYTAQSLALSSSTQNSEKLTWLHRIIGTVVLSQRSSSLRVHCPSVGRHLCFERDKKRYRGTKNDITGQKTISRDISFLCHRVIALIKAQVCDKTVYQHGKCFIFLKYHQIVIMVHFALFNIRLISFSVF